MAPVSGNPFAGDAALNVPVALTCSNILLVTGVTDAACCGATIGFSASFFAVFTAVFFSFFGSTIFSFATTFVAAAFFTEAAFFASTAGVFPASSATTFFGRPRFFIVDGSAVVVVDDMLATQLRIRGVRIGRPKRGYCCCDVQKRRFGRV
ncbi:hypothetical protein EJ02DRAFT_457235 [Clathrospora elynae]|uniref:Uncharacterized protein n=1 Tax=Clathrospora elynae TaxID=706981 RepID=A0A6A5SEM2_9PLEO|nr:hypothetical protein EJ02DRAFT_457235 [Clathrospora elynae]